MSQPILVILPKRQKTKACRCLILNPYSRTLKVAIMPQTLENWYAVIGTDQVEQFYLKDKEGTSCIYTDDLHNKVARYGTQLADWYQPIIGILLFVGPPDSEGNTTDITDEAIQQLEEEFKKAKIGKLIRV